MDREQATEINRHLQRAVNAMRRAEKLILDLDQEDRAALAKPFGNAVFALHFELLREIYDRFPDMEPPAKGARFVDSKLTWRQVQLPPSVTVIDFDRVILSFLGKYGRETVAIVGRVSEHYANLGISLDPAIAAARLKAMVDSGLIEGEGDLRKWRFSEVRLKT